MKHGQVSLFVIVGLITLFVVILLFMAGQPEKEAQQQSPAEIVSYVQDQLDAALKHCILTFGTANIGQSARAQSADHWLARCIERRLTACLDLKGSFERRGVSVQAGKPDATIVLGSEAVSASLSYPVTAVRTDDSQISRDKFAGKPVPVRLAQLENYSRLIAARAEARNEGDVDLTLLSTLNVNTTVFREGSANRYVMIDPQSRIGIEQYILLFQ